MRKLVQGSKDDLGLSAINGIKAISMLLIVSGHALLFIMGGPVVNAEYYAKVRFHSSILVPDQLSGSLIMDYFIFAI